MERIYLSILNYNLYVSKYEYDLHSKLLQDNLNYYYYIKKNKDKCLQNIDPKFKVKNNDNVCLEDIDIDIKNEKKVKNNLNNLISKGKKFFLNSLKNK